MTVPKDNRLGMTCGGGGVRKCWDTIVQTGELGRQIFNRWRWLYSVDLSSQLSISPQIIGMQNTMYWYSILEFFHAIAIIPIQVLLLCSYCTHFITNCDTVVCLSPAPSRSECHCPHAGHCFTHFSMLGELSPPYWFADMWRFVHVPYNQLKPSLRPVTRCQHDCTFLFFSAFGVGSFGCRSERETKRSCLRSEGCSLITEDTQILTKILILILIHDPH